jgi:hypothetical protein
MKSAIEYWRKGYIPARPVDVEILARELYRRGGWPDHPTLDAFLQYADYPHRTALCDELLGTGTNAGIPESPAASPSAWVGTNPVHAFVTLAIEGDLSNFTPDQGERLITAIAVAAAVSPE